MILAADIFFFFIIHNFLLRKLPLFQHICIFSSEYLSPPTGLFVRQKVILSQTFSSIILFSFSSVFHLLRNITHYSVPMSPFKVSSPYWPFYFHCMFIFCINPTFLDDSCRWHFFFFIFHNFLLRELPLFQHICIFSSEYLSLYEYTFLFNIFFPPIYYSPQDIVLLSVHIPLPISLPPHYLTEQRIIPSSACCDIPMYIIFIFWLRLLVSYFWWRLMMYLPKKKVLVFGEVV